MFHHRRAVDPELLTQVIDCSPSRVELDQAIDVRGAKASLHLARRTSGLLAGTVPLHPK
jgi:hypothetical protein